METGKRIANILSNLEDWLYGDEAGKLCEKFLKALKPGAAEKIYNLCTPRDAQEAVRAITKREIQVEMARGKKSGELEKEFESFGDKADEKLGKILKRGSWSEPDYAIPSRMFCIKYKELAAEIHMWRVAFEPQLEHKLLLFKFQKALMKPELEVVDRNGKTYPNLPLHLASVQQNDTEPQTWCATLNMFIDKNCRSLNTLKENNLLPDQSVHKLSCNLTDRSDDTRFFNNVNATTKKLLETEPINCKHPSANTSALIQKTAIKLAAGEIAIKEVLGKILQQLVQLNEPNQSEKFLDR